jgi:hypothetical protein
MFHIDYSDYLQDSKKLTILHDILKLNQRKRKEQGKSVGTISTIKRDLA